MCLKTATLLFMTVLALSNSNPTNNWKIKREALVEVPIGETVTLLCESNDEDHTFFYWYLNEKNVVIGPGNDYNNGKFRYEVLSGNLTVKQVSKDEEGVYNCVSRGVVHEDVNIRSVRMVVQADWEEVYEQDPNESDQDEVSDDENKTKSIKDKIGGFLFGVALPKMGQIAHKIKEKHQEMGENGGKCPKINIKEKIQVLKVNLFRVVIVFGTLMVVSGVGYAGYRIWKNRYRNPSYLAQSDDDEDSELFITPGASGGTDNMAKSNSTDSFERPGISTDFESILDTRNNK